jgi:DNA-binding CsgD family transcriptional regulator/tetratricopeptide (TPR) repeat protein
LHGHGQTDWLAQLAAEHANFRVVLARAEQRHDGELGLRLAAALWRFWHRHGFWEEGRGWLMRMLALPWPDDRVDMATRATALTGLGWVAHYQNDFPVAEASLEEGLACFRRVGRSDGLTEVLLCRGLLARSVGENRRAMELHEEALSLARDLGNLDRLAESLFHLSIAARELGDYDRAAELCEEGLLLHRSSGHRGGEAFALLGLGDVARDLGEAARARAYCEESITLFRELGEPLGEGFSLHNLGVAAHREGNLDLAITLCDESTAILRRLGAEPALAEVLISLGSILGAADDVAPGLAALTEGLQLAMRVGPRWLVAASLEGIANVVGEHGSPFVVVSLISRADTLRAEIEVPLRPNWRPALERTVANARLTLGAQTFSTAWDLGGARLLDDVVADALQVKIAAGALNSRVERPDAAPHPFGLSPREEDVLRLLVGGCSDRDIAERLFISPRTVSKHVGAILAKLGVLSRGEAAVFAVRQGLV